MSTIKLKFIKDHCGYWNKIYKTGDVIDYTPWDHEFQGISESDRVKKGIFVHCYGNGDFDVFNADMVEPYEYTTGPG